MSVLGGVFGGNNLHPLDPQRFFTDLTASRVTKSGKRVSPESALTLPAYFAAIRVISEDIGKVNLHLYERGADNKTKSIAYSRPDYKVFRYRANKYTSSQTFRELMVQWAMNWGGGVAEIVRNNFGDIIEFYPIHPSRVTIKMTDDGEKEYHILNDGGIPPTVLQSSDVLHIRGFGDSDNGYSLAGYMAETIGTGHAATEFGSAFLGNSMRSSGILKTETKLDPETAQDLRMKWKEYQGSGNAGSVPILSGGLDWVQTQVNPDEAQYIETIKHNVIDIARACRVNPNKLQDWTHATYNNMEQANTDHVIDALMPWFIRFEDEINYKIYGDKPNLFVKHNVNSLMRGDMASRSDYFQKMFRLGVYTVNELRDLEDMNPIENGDMNYVTADLVTVERSLIVEEPDPEPSEPEEAEELDDTQTGDNESDDKAEAILRQAISGICARMANKELIACNRHIEKAKDTESLIAWACDFFEQQKKDYLTQIYQVVEPTGATMNDIVDPIESHCQAIICELHSLKPMEPISESWLVDSIMESIKC